MEKSSEKGRQEVKSNTELRKFFHHKYMGSQQVMYEIHTINKIEVYYSGYKK